MVTMKYHCIITCLHIAGSNGFPYLNCEYLFLFFKITGNRKKYQDIKY